MSHKSRSKVLKKPTLGKKQLTTTWTCDLPGCKNKAGVKQTYWTDFEDDSPPSPDYPPDWVVDSSYYHDNAWNRYGHFTGWNNPFLTYIFCCEEHHQAFNANVDIGEVPITMGCFSWPPSVHDGTITSTLKRIKPNEP